MAGLFVSDFGELSVEGGSSLWHAQTVAWQFLTLGGSQACLFNTATYVSPGNNFPLMVIGLYNASPMSTAIIYVQIYKLFIFKYLLFWLIIKT